MGFQIAMFIVGLVSLIRPEILAPLTRRQHARRLEALRAGAAEAYFEERRALETYPISKRSLRWRRIAGGLMVLASVALFVSQRLG